MLFEKYSENKKLDEIMFDIKELEICNKFDKMNNFTILFFQIRSFGFDYFIDKKV